MGFRGACCVGQQLGEQRMWHDHKHAPTAQEATALALLDGGGDINSGDTHFANALSAVGNRTENLTMSAAQMEPFSTH